MRGARRREPDATGMVPVAGTFRDVTGKPFNADREATRLLNRMFREKDYLVVLLPISRLNATQPHVNADFRESRPRYDGEPDRYPAVVKYAGGFYVTDGHHRVMSLADEEEYYAPVRLFDLDGDTQLDFPLLEHVLRDERDRRSPSPMP